MLQSVGMTGKQMNTMLVYEGLYYTMLSAALSLVLSAALGPLVGSLCSAFWFFTYRLDNDKQVETVILLSKGEINSQKVRERFPQEDCPLGWRSS